MRRVDVREEDVEDVRLSGDDVLDNEERGESEQKVPSAVVFSPDEHCLDGVDQVLRRQQGGQAGADPLVPGFGLSQADAVEQLESVADPAG